MTSLKRKRWSLVMLLLVKVYVALLRWLKRSLSFKTVSYINYEL